MRHEINNKDIFFYGDVHGNVFNLLFDIETAPDGSAFIILGDIGVGFKAIYKNYTPTEEEQEYNAIKFFKCFQRVLEDTAKKNTRIYIFRGNHDNPVYFTGELKAKIENEFPMFTIIEDYDEVVLNDGKVALVIPGGISVDRARRIENESYWKDELIHYDELDKINKEYEIILSHSGPTPQTIVENDKNGKPSIVTYYEKLDSELRNTLAEEAAYWDKVLKKIKPKNIFCGHYHVSEENTIDNCKIKFLDIDEPYKYETEHK